MRSIALVAALSLAVMPVSASAHLREGAQAPDFTARGALAGKPFRLNLKQQLKRGPVVLYFFPKAFTQGCTLETRAFSEAEKDFKKAGAQVIGLSADDYPTLARFSVEECRNAFPVATATPETIRAYDVKLKEGLELTNRTSYVIAPNGKIIYVHSEPAWQDHVKNTLAAVQQWRASAKGKGR